MVSVEIPEQALSHSCAHCGRFEQPFDRERMPKCGKCKRRWYCNAQHQLEHWPEHKRACKLLQQGNMAQVEFNKRKEINAMMAEWSVNSGADIVIANEDE